MRFDDNATCAILFGQHHLNLARIEQAGATGVYVPVNVATGRQVADLIHQVTVKYGPVSALVHGAGVLADKRIDCLFTTFAVNEPVALRMQGIEVNVFLNHDNGLPDQANTYFTNDKTLTEKADLLARWTRATPTSWRRASGPSTPSSPGS